MATNYVGKSVVKIDGREALSLKEIAERCGLTEFRVRKAHRDGKLVTQEVGIHGGKSTKVYAFTEDVDAWRAAVGSTKRDDGRGKYTFYGTQEEFDAVSKKVAEVLGDDWAELFFRTNVKK